MRGRWGRSAPRRLAAAIALAASAASAQTLKTIQGRGVLNCGANGTLDLTADAPGKISVETHLLDWSGELYGRRMELAFHARIRDERRFSGPDELKKQIAADAAAARALLAAENGSQ